jgi:hypothetical protein
MFMLYSCCVQLSRKEILMTKAGQVSSALIPTSPLLLTESKDEFNLIRDNLNDQIKPRGIIEQIYVEDIAYLVWEILRLRRSKAAIINLAFRPALKEVITQLLIQPGGLKFQVEDESKKLAHNWFCDPNVKKQIAELLRDFHLDETAIEAEAFRKSADDLEGIDRLMASAEARRDKALVCVAQYRGDFGALLRESSNRLVDGKVLKLEHAGSKERKPAA